MSEQNYLRNEFKEILDKLAVKFSYKEIAVKLGITSSIISKFLKGTSKSFHGKPIEKIIENLKNDTDFKRILEFTKIDVSLYDFLFLFYYWSSKEEIRLGLLCICKENHLANKFYYLETDTKGNFIEKRMLDVKSVLYKDSETIDVIIESQKNTGATFISGHIGSKEIDNIEISFCSYCGAMGSTQKPFAGVGLLQKIDKGNFDNTLEKLKTKGIPPQITNALYKRRFELSSDEIEVFESLDNIGKKTREQIKFIQGFWTGYYLRHLIEGPEGLGGIVKVLMYVDQSGIAELKYRETTDTTLKEIITYQGIFKFPIDKSTTITIGKFQNLNNINQLIIHVKPETKKMKGLITGWRTIDTGYFSSPILFEKITSPNIDSDKSTLEMMETLMNEIKPARYDKSNKLEFANQIKTLRKIQESLFETVERCIEC